MKIQEEADKTADEVHIVGPQALLKRVTHIPAGFSTGIRGTLRETGRKPVPARGIQNAESLGRGMAAIAVQHDHKGSSGREAVRHIQPVMALHTAVAEYEKGVGVHTAPRGGGGKGGQKKRRHGQQ